jgi:peptidoglycan hydrolase-like protein with peptidoglycan-binding domain
MENNLNEELLRQLLLMNFDRARTLSEQSVIGAPMGGVVDNKSYEKFDNVNPCNKGSLQPTGGRCPGKDAFIIIRKQIEGNGYWFSSLGTDEDAILQSLKKLKNKEDYQNLLFWMYKTYRESVGSTVLGFIQDQEFSKGSWGSEMYRNSPVGLGQEIQWQFNDSWLKKYQDILQKFNTDEIYSQETPIDKNTTYEVPLVVQKLSKATFGNDKAQDYIFDILKTDSRALKNLIPPFTRELAHTVLPIVALALSMIPAGQSMGVWLLKTSVGIGIELLDSAIYKFVDQDDYAAGLSLIFAFAGPLDDGLGLLIKKYGSSLIKKIALKNTKYTDEELELLSDVSANSAKYTRLTKIGLRVQSIKRLIGKTKNLLELSKTINWLFKKGAVTSKFMTKMGVTVGGSFITWDKLASYYNICNSQPLKNAKKSDNAILQKIGDIGDVLQPYSTPCDKIIAENAKARAIESVDTLNKRIILTFEEYLKNPFLLSDKLKNVPMIEVKFVQYILMNRGNNFIKKYNYSYKSDINNKLYFLNAGKVKNVTVYSATGTLISSYQNVNKKESFSFDTKKGMKGVGILKIETIDGKTTNNKAFFGSSFSSTLSSPISEQVTFKYGYYDEKTKLAVEGFQKENDITVDGTVGTETIETMLNGLKSNKYGEIKNYDGSSFSEKEIMNIRDLSIKIARQEAEKNQKLQDEEVKNMNQSEFDKVRNESIKHIQQVGEGLDMYDEDPSDSETKEINNINPKSL